MSKKNETKKGGARLGAGRKSIDDQFKKQQISLYIETWVIEKHGGKKAVQKKCTDFLNDSES
jgi:hypothetical protein